jgi:hypothetical protein
VPAVQCLFLSTVLWYEQYVYTSDCHQGFHDIQNTCVIRHIVKVRLLVKIWTCSDAILSNTTVLSASKYIGNTFYRPLISLCFEIRHQYLVQFDNAVLVFGIEKIMTKITFIGTIFDVEIKYKINKLFQNFRT